MGAGTDPLSSLEFLALTVNVSVSASGQKVYVNSAKALGSASGASNLKLSICYKASAGSVTAVGNGVSALKVPAGTTVPMGLSTIIVGLAVDTYNVGLSVSFTPYTA